LTLPSQSALSEGWRMETISYPSWEWSSPRWFNLSAPLWIIHFRRIALAFCLWTLFNRRCADGDHYWGVGLLQIDHRHLFCIAHSGISILFIGRIP
jgi:hypothetical protein